MSGKQISKKKSLEKMRVEKLTEAFSTWAKRDPDSFREAAPDLLRQGVTKATGYSPKASRKLEYWLTDEWKLESFDGLFEFAKHPNESFTKCNLNHNRYKGVKRDWLDTLSDKFTSTSDQHSGDYHRWDRHLRDQFIILGMIAQNKEGASQGEMARHLGIKFEDEASKRYAANVVRAAKIALTRLSLSAGIEGGIFSKAKGHGLHRQHSFESEEIRNLTSRWIKCHPANAMVPQFEE